MIYQWFSASVVFFVSEKPNKTPTTLIVLPFCVFIFLSVLCIFFWSFWSPDKLRYDTLRYKNLQQVKRWPKGWSIRGHSHIKIGHLLSCQLPRNIPSILFFIYSMLFSIFSLTMCYNNHVINIQAFCWVTTASVMALLPIWTVVCSFLFAWRFISEAIYPTVRLFEATYPSSYYHTPFHRTLIYR